MQSAPTSKASKSKTTYRNDYINIILNGDLCVVSIIVSIVFIGTLEAEIWHIAFCGRSGPAPRLNQIIFTKSCQMVKNIIVFNILNSIPYHIWSVGQDFSARYMVCFCFC